MKIFTESITCKCCSIHYYHAEGSYITNDEHDFFICKKCAMKAEPAKIDDKNTQTEL
jgi:hypothetical protein